MSHVALVAGFHNGAHHSRVIYFLVFIEFVTPRHAGRVENEAMQARLEERCKSIVNQGLYFRNGIIDRQKA